MKEKQLELNKTKNDALHNTTKTIPNRQPLPNNQPTFGRFAKNRMSMDQALDTLLLLKERINNKGENFGTLEIGSSGLEKIKNAFWKFVGFFKKSSAEKRTKQLNAKIDDFLQKLDEKKATNGFVNKVIVPVLNDKNAYADDKTACLDMFRNRPDLLGQILQQCKVTDKTELQSFLKTCLSITLDEANGILAESLLRQPPPMDKKTYKCTKKYVMSCRARRTRRSSIR